MPRNKIINIIILISLKKTRVKRLGEINNRGEKVSASYKTRFN